MRNALLSQVKTGDTLIADAGFSCVKAGPVIIHTDHTGHYFVCKDGRHYIDGQADDGELLIGLARP